MKILPTFPLDALPRVVREFALATAQDLGVDPSGVAMVALAALGGAIDGRTRLAMTGHGSWQVSARLWLLAVGAPIDRGGPIVNAALAPLRNLDGSRRQEHQAQLAANRTAKRPKAADPPLVRLVVDEAGPSATARLHDRQPQGFVVLRDEVVGWLDLMQRYPARPERVLWTRLADGAGLHIARVKTPIDLDSPSVGFIAGVHRERLAALAGLPSGGLLARFVPLMLSSAIGPAVETVSEFAATYAALVEGLADAEPVQLTLDDDALVAMSGLRARLHAGVESTTGGLQATIGKLPNVAGALAVILHLADGRGAAPVARDTVAAVVAIITFLGAHAVAFHDAIAEAALAAPTI